MKKSFLVVGLLAAIVLTVGLSSCGQSTPPLAPGAYGVNQMGVGSTVYDMVTGTPVRIQQVMPGGYAVVFPWGAVEFRQANMLSGATNCYGGICVGNQVYMGQGYPPVYVNQIFSNGMIGTSAQFGVMTGLQFSMGSSWRIWKNF